MQALIKSPSHQAAMENKMLPVRFSSLLSASIFLSASVLAASVLAVAPAFAADLPARQYPTAPVVVSPAYDWSGFYLGANVGGSWDSGTITNTALDGTFVSEKQWCDWRRPDRL
jgi:hypothetical protein